MNGVTVIEEILCHEVSLATTIAIIIFMSCLCAFGLCMYRWMYKSTSSSGVRKTIIVCSFLMIGVLIFAWVMSISRYLETHMEYIVEVTDEASYLEFIDKYMVISRDGNQFRVLEIQN